MTYFVGRKGAVKLRRGSDISYGYLTVTLPPDDVIVELNRFAIDDPDFSILIGDRVEITTTDPRGLAFIDASAWETNTVDNSIIAFAHVNAVGGVRLFKSFEDAVNNNRDNELKLTTFNGAPITFQLELRDTTFNVLGDVVSYTFTTDREALDVTTLSDRFKQQLSAGLLSGSGTFDCLFNYKSNNFQEPSLLMLQLTQRLELGSEFALYLFLTDQAIDPDLPSIFYELTACITRAGVVVPADNLVRCTIDYVTTGDIVLRYGRPSAYILKEDEDRIRLEQSLDFLLQEIED